MDHVLTETLRTAQRLGFFGAAPIEDAIAHASGYLPAVGPLSPGSRLADLGSGGGLPGLVLATAHPEVEVVLIDRRQKRTDFLERAVRRLGLTHTSVWCGDVGRRRACRGVRRDPALRCGHRTGVRSARDHADTGGPRCWSGRREGGS